MKILYVFINNFDIENMPDTCAAFGCHNRRKPNDGLSFFRFPLNNPEISKRWIHTVRRKNFTPSPFSKICSEHFLPSDILDRHGSYIKHLKPDAVPSVFSFLPYQGVAKTPGTLQQAITQESASTSIKVNGCKNSQMLTVISEKENFKVNQSIQTDEKEYLLQLAVIALKRKIRILRQTIKDSDLEYQI